MMHAQYINAMFVWRLVFVKQTTCNLAKRQERRFLSGIEKVLWVLYNEDGNEQKVTEIFTRVKKYHHI